MRDKCRVCNRKLITEKSKQHEVGVKCYRKLLKGYRGIQVEPFEDVNKIKEKLSA